MQDAAQAQLKSSALFKVTKIVHRVTKRGIKDILQHNFY